MAGSDAQIMTIYILSISGTRFVSELENIEEVSSYMGDSSVGHDPIA